MPPQIALILATYNRSTSLERLLNNLKKQTISRDRWELIIGVDGGEDDTVDILKKWKDHDELPLSWFRQTNAGQSVARHKAILASKSPYIIIIDDDMEVCPGFIQSHLNALQKFPGKTVVIGKVIPEKNWQKKPLYEAIREYHMLKLHTTLEKEKAIPSSSAFVTQNVSFPKNLYIQCGGFDPNLRLDEDRELGMRLERSGGLFIYSKNAWAIHLSDVGSYEKWFQRQYEYGKIAVTIWEQYKKDPFLHPLRNHVTGSFLNRLLVSSVLFSEILTQKTMQLLQFSGNLLHKKGFFKLAVATHIAIYTLQYHRGVKHRFGSWKNFKKIKLAYTNDPHRPVLSTREGPTYKTDE